MSLAAHKFITRRADEELFNRGNLSVATELFTPDFVYHDPASGADQRGVGAIVQHVQTFRTAFSDLHLAIAEQVAEGDTVAYRWTARGTHRGELHGIPPTHKQVHVTGLAISRLVGGKIAEIWEQYDGLGLLQQLGVFPAAPLTTSPSVPPRPGATNGQELTAEQHKALLMEYTEEVWNRGNLDAIERYIAPDYLRHQAGWSQAELGPAAVRDSFTRELSAFADLHIATEALVAEGDMVAMRLCLSAIHAGEAFGIAPTGNAVALKSIHLYRFAAGKIVEHWLESDMLGLLQQLGAIPTPA